MLGKFTDKVIMWVVVAILAFSGGFGWYKYYADAKKDNEPAVAVTPTPTVTVTPEVTVTPTTSPTPTVTPIVDEGVTWITPKKMKDLKLFGDSIHNGYEYYQVATLTGSGKIIDAFEIGMGSTLYRFKYSGGKYYFLPSNSASYSGAFADKVKYDYETAYSGITTPASVLGADNVKYMGGGYYYYDYIFFKSLVNPSEITSTDYGKIFRVDSKIAGEYGKETTKYIDGAYVRRIYLKSADTTVPAYRIGSGIMKDNGVADVTFLNGKKNKDVYLDRFGLTCGRSSGQTIIKSSAAMVNDLVENGRATNGTKIYTIVNKNNELLKLVYDAYGQTHDYSGAPTAESYNSFIAGKPILAYKDALGDYNVFIKEKYQPLAECGKPVVYLYPTKAQKVSVKVGADITKSEPDYGKGWNVVANPNGKLVWNGKEYPNLFWEGTGWGEYPQITEGTVVKTAGVRSVLINQMKQLGLNATERADFLEFWMPKMPKTKYVRLTWFDTNQMDRLAPLKVTPRPDISIRVFLDFRGMDEFVKMTPQKLTAPQRKGFTLVEWGGLLVK